MIGQVATAARYRLVLLARLAVCAYAGWSVGAIVVEALDVILAAPG